MEKIKRDAEGLFAMYLGAIDIGGTKTISAVTDEAGTLLASCQFETIRGDYAAHFSLCCEKLGECLRELGITAKALSGVGVVVPGMVSGNVLLLAPFAGWHDVDIVAEFSRLLGDEVSLIVTEGDVNACGIAEAYFGGYTDLWWVTVSTGIGSAIILNGQLYTGSHNVAGEIGHVKVEFEHPRVCSCRQKGCAEAMASGRGIGAMVQEAAERDPAYARLFADEGLPIDARGCEALARKGDPTSLSIYEKAGVYLGRALSTGLNLLDPQRVFIGGGVAYALDLMLPSIRKTLRENCIPFVQEVPIERTKLGYHASVKGAAALVLRCLNQ
mgnify:CR=1 FL=1